MIDPSAPSGHLPLKGEAHTYSKPENPYSLLVAFEALRRSSHFLSKAPLLRGASAEGGWGVIHFMGHIPRQIALLPLAREARKAMTPWERHLWYDFLRSYPIKCYRQRIIGLYIADFYCAKAKLVIELDGSQHYTKESQEYDRARTAYLEALSLKVIRFSNSDVDRNFLGVCTCIDKTIQAQIAAGKDFLSCQLPS